MRSEVTRYAGRACLQPVASGVVARQVLWVIKGLGPGGAERLLVEAAGALTDDELAITCAYVVPAKRHLVPQLMATGVNCVCVSRGTRDVWWPLRLVRLVRSGGFDVVHVHSPLPGSITRLAVRSIPEPRPQVVTTEHNSVRSYRWPTRVLNHVTSRWDAHTFAVSAEVAGSLKGRAGAGVSVVTHGIDVAEVQARLGERKRIRAELGVVDDEVVVGTVANFREQKDYPTLLGACALLRHRGVAFRLVAVGQGPLEGEVRALHRDLGLDEQVDLLGYREDAVDVLAACDVFVLASRFEGLPVALMEACALGLPSVLTDVGGMRAVLGDDGALWVPAESPTDLADALAQAIASSSTRERLAAVALVAAQQFDGAAFAAELRRWYLTGGRMIAPLTAGLSLVGVTRRRATADDLPAILELCRRTLGWDDSGDWDGLYRWKHVDNPFGPSPTWVATVDDRVVALRVFLRWNFRRGDQLLHAVRAVDTATDAEFRGKGLFTALTSEALPELRAEGVTMVFNTPNDQSLPGYLKMGWRTVGRLRPVVRPLGLHSLARLVRSRVPASLWAQPFTIGRSVEEWLATDAAVVLSAHPRTDGLRTSVDEAFARWRFGSALQPCRVIGTGGLVAVVQLRTRGRARELVCLVAWGAARDIDRLLVETARAAEADVVLRLGRPSPSRGFIGVRALGPRLTCLMLADLTPPPLSEWQLTMADVALF